jgi:hypothetical protein
MWSAEFLLWGSEFASDKRFVPFSYVQTTYQATDWLSVGYQIAYTDYEEPNGLPPIVENAVAASFAIQPWWLLKLEVRHTQGTGGLFASSDTLSSAPLDDEWLLYTFKSTFSF